MFSCCCAKVDFSWTPVCGCASASADESLSKTCQTKCLKEASLEKHNYFFGGTEVFEYLKELYPNARFWFTGHSLGGAIASLVALTDKTTSAITFASPGDKLYAERVGLDPNNNLNIWHFGVETDPIFRGKCNGVKSSCYIGGYAMETACHTGNVCTYAKEGRMDILKHRMGYLIDNVITKEKNVPKCAPEFNCEDCKHWTFE